MNGEAQSGPVLEELMLRKLMMTTIMVVVLHNKPFFLCLTDELFSSQPMLQRESPEESLVLNERHEWPEFQAASLQVPRRLLSVAQSRQTPSDSHRDWRDWNWSGNGPGYVLHPILVCASPKEN